MLRAIAERRHLFLLLAWILLPAAALATPSANATVRAVVVGIDTYQDPNFLPTLRGAVNDARDLSETFRSLGIEDLTVILDDQARRDTVLEAWDAVLGRAQPDDIIFLTYAGHGMRAPAPPDSSEEDGMNEFYPLYGFSEAGDGKREFILDDEIFTWARRAEAKGVRVALVTDACHSGSPFRKIDPRISGVRYRFAGVSIDDDMLEGLEVTEESESIALPRNFMSFGAALDTQKVAELLMPDRERGLEYRGALSYFLSRGLQGAADDDRNGLIGFEELKRYVVRNIQFKTNAQQNPVVVAGTLDRQALMDLGKAETVQLASRPGPVRLTVLNKTQAPLPELQGVVVAPPGVQADLIWDVDQEEVVSGLDTVIARDVRGVSIQGVIDRQRARDRLAALAERNALDMALKPNRPIYREGESLTLEVEDLHFPHLLLFNLASDGKVQLIYPLDAEEAKPKPPNSAFRLGEIDVAGPFGADLLVAVTTKNPRPHLIAELGALSDQSEAEGMANALQAAEQLEKWLRGQSFRIGIQALYTCENEDSRC